MHLICTAYPSTDGCLEWHRLARDLLSSSVRYQVFRMSRNTTLPIVPPATPGSNPRSGSSTTTVTSGSLYFQSSGIATDSSATSTTNGGETSITLMILAWWI